MGRIFELHLAADYGLFFRSRRTATDLDRLHGPRFGNGFSGYAMADRCALILQTARSRTLAFLHLRELQRGDGRPPDGNHAGRSAYLWILAGLQSRHRAIRRVYTRDLYLSDRHNPRQSNARGLDVVRSALRADRCIAGLRPQPRPGGETGLRVGVRNQNSESRIRKSEVRSQNLRAGSNTLKRRVLNSGFWILDSGS
jgi:hypothetical protein